MEYFWPRPKVTAARWIFIWKTGRSWIKINQNTRSCSHLQTLASIVHRIFRLVKLSTFNQIQVEIHNHVKFNHVCSVISQIRGQMHVHYWYFQYARTTIGSPKRRVECTNNASKCPICIKLAPFLCHLSRAASTQLKSSVDIYRLYLRLATTVYLNWRIYDFGKTQNTSHT
jgi:hypothetical protein